MTNTRISTTAAALTATLGLAAAAWATSIPQMSGMEICSAASLGPFTGFMTIWVPMMAAMMLPGVAPAALRHARSDGRLTAVLLFVGSYLAVWALAGIPAYAFHRPHGPVVVGVVTIAAGLYELTPLKQAFRRLCCKGAGTGLRCGLYCVGSCIGLMLMQMALGTMSMTWTVATAALVTAQKLLPPRAAVDVPVALAIIGFGVLIVAAPSPVSAPMPPM